VIHEHAYTPSSFDRTTPKTSGPQPLNFDAFNLVLDAIPDEWSKTIASLACVQKSWKYPAQRRLFHTVVLIDGKQVYRFISAIIQHLGPGNHWRDATALNLRVKHVTLAPGIGLGNETPILLNMTSNVLPVLQDLRSVGYDVRLLDDTSFRRSIIDRWSTLIPPTVTTVCLSVDIFIIWIKLDN
jgi:hypothetical protein